MARKKDAQDVAPEEGAFDEGAQPASFDEPTAGEPDAQPEQGEPEGQGALPGVATHEEVNRSVLKDSELKAAGKLLTKAQGALGVARDGMLDMIACGSEAPETLEKASQLVKAAMDLVTDAHNRVRGAEI